MMTISRDPTSARGQEPTKRSHEAACCASPPDKMRTFAALSAGLRYDDRPGGAGYRNCAGRSPSPSRRPLVLSQWLTLDTRRSSTFYIEAGSSDSGPGGPVRIAEALSDRRGPGRIGGGPACAEDPAADTPGMARRLSPRVQGRLDPAALQPKWRALARCGAADQRRFRVAAPAPRSWESPVSRRAPVVGGRKRGAEPGRRSHPSSTSSRSRWLRCWMAAREGLVARRLHGDRRLRPCG